MWDILILGLLQQMYDYLSSVQYRTEENRTEHKCWSHMVNDVSKDSNINATAKTTKKKPIYYGENDSIS